MGDDWTATTTRCKGIESYTAIGTTTNYCKKCENGQSGRAEWTITLETGIVMKL